MLKINILLLAALSLSAIGCSSAPSQTPATVSAAETSAPASQEADPAKPAPAKEFVTSGPLIVENQVDVAAQRDGIIAKIVADSGTRVSKGQLLAALDDRQISADLEAARAKTRSTENDLKNWEAEAKVLEVDYQRAEKMWEAHIIPKEQLEHAQYKAESDQWDVKRVSELLVNAKDVEHSLELELEKTRIVAPFDGVVARRYIRAGQSVSRGDRLFWVTAVSPLRVRITLPEQFLARIRAGSRVAVTAAEENLGHGYSAKVIEISPVVDPASDTIDVLAELYGNTSGLRPGMRVDVHLPNLP